MLQTPQFFAARAFAVPVPPVRAAPLASSVVWVRPAVAEVVGATDAARGARAAAAIAAVSAVAAAAKQNRGRRQQHGARFARAALLSDDQQVATAPGKRGGRAAWLQPLRRALTSGPLARLLWWRRRERLPVTVLSGFLGAGKTTLLKQILRSAGNETGKAPLRLAVIVNDMGEVNLDASEIKSSRLIQEEATMVELENGCICCTLRGDLLRTVKALSEERAFDYLVIESTGISEPLPVAQTFVMDVDDMQMTEEEEEEESGDAGDAAEGSPADPPAAAHVTPASDPLQSLSRFARLDTMVTVVDALNIRDVLDSLETLAEKNITGMIGNTGDVQSGEGDAAPVQVDDRSIAHLMLDQIEFADVILLSKVHLVEGGADAVAEIRALLQKLNPSAKVIAPAQPNFADLPLSAVINTHLFDMEKAESSAGWMQELEKSAFGGAGHTPETEEYGISSFVFSDSERPFHPGRLAEALGGFATYSSSVAAGEREGAPQEQARASVFSGVVRAKGHFWMASANARPVDLHVAGRHVQLEASQGPFLAAVPQEEWLPEFRELHEDLLAAGSWHATNGDRGTMVVFIGIGLDKAGILAELGAAQLTDAEMAGGLAGWKAFEDPFFEGKFFENTEYLSEPSLLVLAE